MYALIDCNNFYASCESLFDPKLQRRPLVVLSNNDGCVISRSAEAKALGIKMGVPIFQIKDEVTRHNIAVRSTNFELYGDMSNRVMMTIEEMSPDVERYSIDEAFVKIPASSEYLNFGSEIKKRITKHIGIPVGVGIGPTKTLAKVANWHAKKRGNGLTILSTSAQCEAVLRIMPIEEVWGVGRKHCKRLRSYGVQTAYDFIQKIPEHQVQGWMTIQGVRTWRELQGFACIDLEEVAPAKQSIATTRSFGKMVDRLSELEEAVATFVESCAGKARKEGVVARRLQVFIHTNMFRKDLPTYARNRIIQLPVPTADTLELVRYAKQALASIFSSRYEYKKAGVILMDLVTNSEVQTSFLDTVNREKSEALTQAMDKLTTRFGRRSLHLAASGTRTKKARWHMNQNSLSPCYTTRLSDVMVVKNI